MRHDRGDVLERAKGRWRGILKDVGIPDSALTGKHGPCPLCGEGTDRFRWDNKEGKGTYFCGQCGPGDGVGLVMKFQSMTFPEALDRVARLVGVVKAEPAREGLSDDECNAIRRELWLASSPVVSGDVVDRYLTARGVGEIVYPKVLRTCPRCRFERGVFHPAMLAVVSDPDGKAVQLHRTYLGDGAKLDVPEPRKMAPGRIPAGSAVRLSEPGPILGIAEGIETAMKASNRFGVPVWAAVSATGLAQWEPPACVEEVLIFGDADRKFGGQKAGFSLAHRLAVKAGGPDVSVHIPPRLGTDWADAQEGDE